MRVGPKGSVAVSPEAQPHLPHFDVGDLVRVTRPHPDFEGKVGRIGRRAHPASPWTWVVYNLPEDVPMWGLAVNAPDIEAVESA